MVLLDVKMPGLDGLETLRRIKAMHPLVETIMLTAHATVATAVEAMRISAQELFDEALRSCGVNRQG